MTLRRIGLVFLLIGASCSAEVSIGDSRTLDSDDMARLIDDEFEDQLDVGDLDTTCFVPNELEEGDTFECSSVTLDGRTIWWDAVATDPSNANVNTRNVLTPENLVNFEAEVVRALEEEAGGPLGVDNFDCGDEMVIVPESGEVVCALTNPADGATYDATVTIRDLDDLRFGVDVANTPRS